MTIQLGGQQFTEAEIIAAIAASNDGDHTHEISADVTLGELSGVVQAVLHRLTALENRLPDIRTAYAVTTTVEGDVTKYRVQTQDYLGKTCFVTFEVPN